MANNYALLQVRPETRNLFRKIKDKIGLTSDNEMLRQMCLRFAVETGIDKEVFFNAQQRDDKENLNK